MNRSWLPLLTLVSLSALAQGISPEEENYKPPVLAHPIPSLSEKRDSQKAVPSLSLEKSISYAIQAATDVIKSRGELEVTAQQLIQGYAQFLPNLLGTAGVGRVEGRQFLTTGPPTLVDSTVRTANWNLQTTLNIFNGVADLASFKSSLNRKEAAELTLKRVKQQIALDVSQTYLQVILDQQLVKIAEKNLASSQARESLLREQTRVGVRNLADLFRQQAQTSSDEAFLVNAQAKVRTDQISLLRKLRIDTNENYSLVEPKLEQEASGNKYDNEDKLIKTALDGRSDLTASEDITRATRWDLTSARSGYFPKLDFAASIGSIAGVFTRDVVNGTDDLAAYTGTTPTIESQLKNELQYTYGLKLTWNIFDRWTTRVGTERARVNLTNASLDLEDRKYQVIGEIRQAFGDYRAVLQQLESTKKGLLAAIKAYEVVKGRYQVGSASFVDLTLAQATLVQAEAARAQAIIGFALQKLALETAMGTVAVE
jgi:outer membrane protein